VYEALEVLSQLGDFVVFKQLMMATKTQVQGGGSLGMIDAGVLDVPKYMEIIQDLTKDADLQDGWVNLLDDPMASVFAKHVDGGDNTLLRLSVHLDLKPHEGFAMFEDTSMESTNWKPVKASETLSQNGEEKLVRITPDVAWAVRYLMGVPEIATLKMILRKDFP